MAEYSKKTVADLTEILKSRGLPATGKKADLIARLTEADKTAETTETGTSAPEPESEVAPPEPVEPVQEQPVAEEATAVQSGAEATEPATEAEAAPADDAKAFAMNLAASDVDREMEKRQRRAERFGTGGQANADAEATETATADTDAQKNLERAKRFGSGQTAIGKLDEALSGDRERGSRGRKRGAGAVEESSTLDDPGLKSNFNRKGRFANRRRGGPGKPTGIAKPSAYSSDKDREAAESRRKRFAAQ